MLHEDLFALASKVASVPAEDREFDDIREALATLAAKVLATPSLRDPRDPSGQRLAEIFRYLDRQFTTLRERRARGATEGDDAFLFGDADQDPKAPAERPPPKLTLVRPVEPTASAAIEPPVPVKIAPPAIPPAEPRLKLPEAPKLATTPTALRTVPLGAIEALSQEERIALFS
jgi:hypothetical protein